MEIRQCPSKNTFCEVISNTKKVQYYYSRKLVYKVKLMESEGINGENRVLQKVQKRAYIREH